MNKKYVVFGGTEYDLNDGTDCLTICDSMDENEG